MAKRFHQIQQIKIRHRLVECQEDILTRLRIMELIAQNGKQPDRIVQTVDGSLLL
jgi:hypothetical protein